MNAKKIMGAVLVALLAAALFIGAGAAAVTNAANGDTVFVNQKLDSSIYGGNWIGSNGAVTPFPADESGYVYFPAGTEGVYTYTDGTNEYTLTVKSPEILVSGIAGTGVSAYKFIDGIYYIGTPSVDVNINSAASDAPNFEVYLTLPDGNEVNVGNQASGAGYIEGVLYTDATTKPTVGEYSICVVFDESYFVNGTLYTNLISKPVTFKVAEADSTTITASVDQALPSDTFKVTITGQPGKDFTVSFDENEFFVVAKQLGLPNVKTTAPTSGIFNDDFTFEMPNTGKVEFTASVGTGADKTAKMNVKKDGSDKTQSVSIKVLKGTITAEADAASYFVGDVITISGVNTAGTITKITLKGTNFVNESIISLIDEWTVGDASAKDFEFELGTADIVNAKAGFEGKFLDVGTYTLTIENANAKATVAVVLKQPFISIIEAPEVIVQETEAEFIINAEATTKIRYYIFGTNYFNASADIDDLVEDTTNQFTFTLGEAQTKAMDAGQYFMVVQHPMYDEEFNIIANGFTIELVGDNENTKLFDVELRQTANAAQALCDALDTQNIDDMYVKYSFFVVGEDESFTISDIPETVAQGDTITISGVSTSNAGDYVTVEMISTAFAAVPKETVGSAAFIAVTTQIAEDGTWEVTFDTSDLNVDEYSLKVACGDKTWKNVEVNVVEAADEPVTPPTDKPDEPVTPPQDDAPETPGFGALAALAGLGAVAVLLLRRE